MFFHLLRDLSLDLNFSMKFLILNLVYKKGHLAKPSYKITPSYTLVVTPSDSPKDAILGLINNAMLLPLRAPHMPYQKRVDNIVYLLIYRNVRLEYILMNFLTFNFSKKKNSFTPLEGNRYAHILNKLQCPLYHFHY